ncbi:uncharacterized protein LOC134177642 [Corticium candelabrum]|uniref:uncharacterized protein LOC134177642 n=1 Tax=Corticium candelabrum TaxID=121492 RepID=UPI002E275C79|nr:uncharacterized protein LOC134177642 [Corticium candelabrum]
MLLLKRSRNDVEIEIETSRWMKGSPHHRKALFLFCVFTVLATTCYLIKYIGISKSSLAELAVKHSQGEEKRAFPLARDQGRCTTLWKRSGCGSRRPILRCKPYPSTEEDRHYDAVVKTFDSLLYLNGCRHETCSLVGSSGNLKNRARGKMIDRSKIVIRLNNQPITGYEKYVGTRPADIMIFNYQTDCFTNTSHPTLYIRSADKPLREDAVIIKKCQANRFAPLYSLSTYVQHQAQILLKTYAVRYNVQREVYSSKGNYFHATSGFKALIFSMMICRQVHLFGFGMQEAKTWHYYPPYRKYTPPHHEMFLEMKIIQDIAKRTLNSSIANFLDKEFSNLIVY